MVLLMFDEISRCSSTDKAYRGTDLRRFGNFVSSVYAPVLAKHSKHFVLADAIDVWLGRMQRNFEPMRKQVEGRCKSHLTDGSRSCHSVLAVPARRRPSSCTR